MSRIRLAAAGVLAVAVAAGAFASLAAGEKESSGKDHSKELEFTKIVPDTVMGKVSEERKAFNRGRTVVIKYWDGFNENGFEKIGKDKTNRRGIFKIKGSFFVGKYLAILKPQRHSHRAREEDAVVEEEAEDDEEAGTSHRRGTGTRTTTTE